MDNDKIMPSQENVILLDFNTIIDPVSLLTGLTIYRKSHEKLYVRGESLVYQYNYESEPFLGDNFGRFDDKDALNMASSVCKRQSNDIELMPNNLCLAIRLLQHAIKERIITVLDDHLLGEWYRSDNYVSEKEINDLKAFKYIDKHLYSGAKYNSIILEPDTPGQRLRDISMSLKQGWDMTLGGRTFSFLDLENSAKIQPKNIGKYEETISLITAERFETYAAIIDNPNIFSSISEATTTAINEENYQKQICCFLPKYVANLFSIGTYSLIEQLWVIVKRQFKNNSNKTD